MTHLAELLTLILPFPLLWALGEIEFFIKLEFPIEPDAFNVDDAGV